MFRDVPECSGIFHVPGFIDGLMDSELLNRTFLCKLTVIILATGRVKMQIN